MLEATVRKQASQLNQFKSKMLSGESDSILLEDPSSLLNSDHLDNNVDIEGSSSDVSFSRLSIKKRGGIANKKDETQYRVKMKKKNGIKI
jgi:hypothetical protein